MSWVAIAAVVVMAGTQSARSQTPQQWQQQLQRMRAQGQQPNIQWENAEVSGAIKGMQGTLVQVAAAGGEQWIVQLEARPQDIVYQGTADPSFVKTGMLVEFKAKVNKKGQAADPVSSLTVFTVREGRGVGVTPEGGLAKGEGELFSENKPEEKKAPRVKKEDDNTVYVVAGQITKLSRLGEMTINCAGTTVKADLDKEAKVAVDVNHLQFAQVGDKVEVRARYPMGQKAAGQGLATQISVTGAKPLGEPKKRALPAKGEDAGAAEPKAEEKPAEPKSE
ncbi:hypothetical protein NA78x_001264 [Anatilimnocola sp. NA78]|uniref:hypothetical protein n=1 Tax=Anatilimnocola sp. NA78 TaxID=3415683 RepID=UPI003CE52F34